MIDSLIDKLDGFEIVRDKIASILVNEIANQKALAIAGGKDPVLWDAKVYIERSNPWEAALNEPYDLTPIINVWYDSSNFDPSKSNIMERQHTTGQFNIDCIGFGIGADDGTGQKIADEDASLNLQRILRLVRNILMAADYTYLDLPRGFIGNRWPKSISVFQPASAERSIIPVVAGRIEMDVTFNEFAPQITPDILDQVFVDIVRSEDGFLMAEADYDYT